MADFGQFSRFDPGQILIPAYPDPRNKLLPFQPGANLTIVKGQALAQKTSDLKMYSFNKAASDGTQIFGGFAQFSFATDSSGTLYKVFGGTAAGQTFYDTGISIGSMWATGVFDPNDVVLALSSGSPTQEVDTATPTGTVTAGDTWSIYQATTGIGATVFANATATVAAIITQMKNAWNANAATAALATATSSSTVLTLTAVGYGEPLNLTSTAEVASTFAPVFAVSVPAATGLQAEVDTFTPGGTIAVGDIFTVTINYPNLTTLPVTYVAVSGDTATTVCNGLRTAWAASQAPNYATASGTSTFILTAVNAGSAMNLTKSTPASATFGKTVTTVAYGRTFSDILAGRPGAYIEQPDGFWVV